MSKFRSAPLVVVFLAAFATCRSQTAPEPQWVGARVGSWVGSWAAAPVSAEGDSFRLFSGVTLRETAHISLGGNKIRLRFTNEFGVDPLTIGDVHVALSAGGASIQPASDRGVTFGGATSVSISPGAAVFSDPVAFTVAPLADVAVSFYLPPQIMRGETFHSFAGQDNYVADGHSPAAPELPQPATLTSWYFFDGIDVAAVPGSRAIVAFGDSITDGVRSTHNMNRRWPDVLAARLSQNSASSRVGVLNEGIGANHLLYRGYGPNALARFDRDVLAQSDVRSVIVLESINDIGGLADVQSPWLAVTASQLEFGFTQLADRAHEHGLKIFGATITPYGGAGYYSDEGEQVREAVNDWMRTSGVFDGVVDFDKITRDPAHPARFNPAYDSGDHLHPNDAGYKAMGDGIDLTLFAQ
jgi:lysophospholipase L1-like esterase